MKAFRLAAVIALVCVPRLALAQPKPGTDGVNIGGKVDVGGQKYTYKGWYLYWPAEAIRQPRMPLPYPWWPAQANGNRYDTPLPPAPAMNPAPQTTSPHVPMPLFLPRDTQNLPTLPGTSWGPGYPMPFQPVAYPVQVPNYWYGR